jgi:uncharacterized protein (DUF1015 family)
MADIAPLTPLRYDLTRLAGSLAPVVAPPYDVISPDERAQLAARNPHNVVRLILPEGEGDTKYTNAAQILGNWRDEGALVRDDEPAFYRFDQTFLPPGATAGSAARPIRRRGFLALVRLVPFAERIVLPHERTLSGPKEDRLKLFRATRTNLSPGFMLYSDPAGELDAHLENAQLLSEFSTPDGVRHALAKVSDPRALKAIVAGIARSTLLIADGHHRYETAVRYGEEVSAAHPQASERAEHRHFMTFLANGDAPSLVVFPTHRHVHSLPSFSFDDMLKRAGEGIFSVTVLPHGASAAALLATLAAFPTAASGETVGARPSPVAVVAAARDGRAALLSLKRGADLEAHPALAAQPAVLRKTGIVLLHSGILHPILGITPEAQAAKTNIWYPQDADLALAELRAGKGDVLFLMNATPTAEVREVAEAGHVMPQKSTFFYPKVLTGLAIHTLDPARVVAGG